MNLMDATAGLVLFAHLTAAVRSDVAERRVGNPLVASLLVLGVALTFVGATQTSGLHDAAVGVGVMALVWFPMFLFRLMGAGDVKLLMASGAWLGLAGSLIATLATGVAGGVLGVWWLARRHGAQAAAHAMSAAVRAPSLLKLRPFDARERVPYAVAIAVGVAVSWIAQFIRMESVS